MNKTQIVCTTHDKEMELQSLDHVDDDGKGNPYWEQAWKAACGCGVKIIIFDKVRIENEISWIVDAEGG